MCKQLDSLPLVRRYQAGYVVGPKPVACQCGEPVSRSAHCRGCGDYLTSADTLTPDAVAAGGEILKTHHGLLKRLLKRWGRMGDRDDLLQEARVGLLIAAKEYDFDRGTKFSTLVGWWVRNRVLGFQQNHGRNVRMPKSVHEWARLARKGHEVPVDIAPFLASEWSLDAPLRVESNDASIPWSASFKDLGPTAEVQMDTASVRGLMLVAKGGLSQHEYHVIERYFSGGETMPQIAVSLGVSRQAIQQVHAKALAKIKSRISFMKPDEQELLREVAA